MPGSMWLAQYVAFRSCGDPKLGWRGQVGSRQVGFLMSTISAILCAAQNVGCRSPALPYTGVRELVRSTRHRAEGVARKQ